MRKEKESRVDDILEERLMMSGWKGWKDFRGGGLLTV
jgi:hypothetical protein